MGMSVLPMIGGGHGSQVAGFATSLFVVLLSTAAPADGITIEDTFGRRLNDRGMVLVDWDGQIANPAIRIVIKPPTDVGFPASAMISSTEPRLYFDLPSTAGATGPSKSLSFANATAAMPVLVSIFPDRDGLDEDHVLEIKFTEAGGAQSTQQLKAHVIDQDKAPSANFHVEVDFSKDKTGFFDDSAKRAIVRQAAEDWGFFFTEMNLSLVAANTEETFIWNPDGFNSGTFVRNASAYRGFLLYAYGINAASPPYRSGGEPSLGGGFQASGATALPIKRSGGVEIEIKGNFNTLGWLLTTGDNDWWKAGNLGGEQNDLYSIAHHEIGHSLIFNPAHTRFGNLKTAGTIQDTQVVAYHGSAPAIDSSDHLHGSLDRLSRKGAFGYEYFGDVPRRRWLITKLDLLVAQAVGYTLRPTSAFTSLAIGTTALPRGAASHFYSETLEASGGIPFYDWSITSGALPDGLVLDPFTGTISGTPTAVGTFTFEARLRDHDSTIPPVTRSFTIRIESSSFVVTVVEHSTAGLRLAFTTVNGRTYHAQYSDDLSSTSWILLGNDVAGTGGVVSLMDPAVANLERRFYRVLEF
jgi:Putative Ig domain